MQPLLYTYTSYATHQIPLLQGTKVFVHQQMCPVMHYVWLHVNTCTFCTNLFWFWAHKCNQTLQYSSISCRHNGFPMVSWTKKQKFNVPSSLVCFSLTYHEQLDYWEQLHSRTAHLHRWSPAVEQTQALLQSVLVRVCWSLDMWIKNDLCCKGVYCGEIIVKSHVCTPIHQYTMAV